MKVCMPLCVIAYTKADRRYCLCLTLMTCHAGQQNVSMWPIAISPEQTELVCVCVFVCVVCVCVCVHVIYVMHAYMLVFVRVYRLKHESYISREGCVTSVTGLIEPAMFRRKAKYRHRFGST